jgi:hypothetical protein
MYIFLFWTCHMNEVIKHMDFCNFLLPFSLTVARFVHAVTCTHTLFFLLPEYIHNSLPLWVDEYLCYFHVLAAINKVAVNTQVLVLCGRLFSPLQGIHLEAELLNHAVAILCNLLGNWQVIFKVAVTPNNVWGFKFLHIITNIYYYFYFLFL